MNEYETHKGSCVGFLGDKRNDKALQWEWHSATAVKPGTPPAIVLLASDDNAVPALTNGVSYYTAMIKAGYFQDQSVFVKLTGSRENCALYTG